MINQQNISWVLAVALSFVLHASLFIQFGAQSGVEHADAGKLPLVTRLTFHKASPAPVTPVEPIVEPTPIKPPPKQNKPVKKIPDKSRKKTPKADHIKPEVVKEKQVLEPVVPQSQGQLAENKSAIFLSEQQAYLQQLLAHIESEKFYPRSARSRGVEGDIEVSFEIMADGSIRSLSTAGGHTILQRAARQAVENSIPLPLPPVDSGMLRKVAFTIQYKLQQ